MPADPPPRDPPPPARPLRKDAQRNRALILDAAREVFAQRGLAVTLDDIAAHAGVGVGTVYRRFSTRDALIEALFEDRVRDVADRAETALSYDDPWQGFTAFVRDLARVHAEDRGLREVLLAENTPARFAEAQAHLAPLLDRLVSAAQEQGTLRRDVTSADLPVLMAMVSAAADHTRPSPAPAANGAWARYLDVLLDGLRATPDRRRDSSGPHHDPHPDEETSP
ncbi:MAG TPA: helix-turn-helix domain-containing protein [Jiangellaceae bacterium]